MSEKERKEIEFRKGDIIHYDDEGIEVRYKNEPWYIKYGNFVCKEDIDKMDPEDIIVVRKFSGNFGWRVANIRKSKEHKEQKEEKEEQKEEKVDFRDTVIKWCRKAIAVGIQDNVLLMIDNEAKVVRSVTVGVLHIGADDFNELISDMQKIGYKLHRISNGDRIIWIEFIGE